MTPETRTLLLTQLWNRIKSLLWRVVMMLAAVVVQWLIENLTQFQLSSATTIVVGLILGEISKWLNTGVPQLKANDTGSA